MSQSQKVEELELKVLAEIQAAKHKFLLATPEEKSGALGRLRDAVQKFSGIVLDGVVPDSVWATAGSEPHAVRIPVGTSLKEGVRLLMEATLRHANGNISAAARILEIDRATLWKRIQQHEAKSSCAVEEQQAQHYEAD